MLAGALITVVALDGRAALVAGRLRAVLPHAPGGRPAGRERCARPPGLLDIEIAATAFAAGLDVATNNPRDFEALRDALAALFPDAPALGVVEGPADPG